MEHTDLAILLERIARLLHAESHAGGLKPTQWEALRYLARANRFSRNPTALTAYLGMTKGTVSQTLNALERKSLICKATEHGDRRQVSLKLTGAGSKLLNNDPVSALADAADDMPPDQKSSLADAMRGFLKAALDRRGGRAFGMCRTCRYFKTCGSTDKPHRCDLLGVSLSEADGLQYCIEFKKAA